MVQEVTRGAPPADLAIPLEDVAGSAFDPAEVAEAVACAASARWSGTWEPSAPDALLAEASSYGVTFRSPNWTWRA
jgi:hypothetical protein